MLTSSFRTTESQAGNQDERVKTTGHYVLKYMDPNDGVSEIILKQNRIPGTEGNAIFVGRKSDCCTDSERKRRVLYIKQLLFELFPLVDTQRDTTVFRAEDNPTSLFRHTQQRSRIYWMPTSLTEWWMVLVSIESKDHQQLERYMQDV
jgi:hypothetical protein